MDTCVKEIEEEFEDGVSIKSCVEQLIDEVEEREAAYFQARGDAQIEEEFEEEESVNSCIKQLIDEVEERETVYVHVQGERQNGYERTEGLEGQKIPDRNGLDHYLTQNMNNMHISQHIPLPPQQLLPSPYQNGELFRENGSVSMRNRDLLPTYHQAPILNNIRGEATSQKIGNVTKVPSVNNGHVNAEICGRQNPFPPMSWTSIEFTNCQLMPPGYTGLYPPFVSKKVVKAPPSTSKVIKNTNIETDWRQARPPMSWTSIDRTNCQLMPPGYTGPYPPFVSKKIIKVPPKKVNKNMNVEQVRCLPKSWTSIEFTNCKLMPPGYLGPYPPCVSKKVPPKKVVTNTNIESRGRQIHCPPKSWTNIESTNCQMMPPGYISSYPPPDNIIKVPPCTSKKVIKSSSLNPNAKPFVMNPNAKEFVPQW